MTYATLQDVRDFGVSTADATDARITRALTRATNAIDRYTGKSFGVQAQSTVILDGIYSGTIPLPSPFSNITSVTIDEIALTTSQWEVRDYGLKLFGIRIRDADGFPLYWAAVRRYPVIPATVKVTATFGESTVDPTIVDACIMLAAGWSRLTADDLLPAAQISNMSSGGISVTQRQIGDHTTGNLEVDSMLDDFIDASKLVN